VDCALAAGDTDAADEMLRLVEAVPRGHVAPLLRALLLTTRAAVDAARKLDDGVETAFAAGAAALRDMDARYYLARALLAHASWLHDSGRLLETAPMLTEARELFASLRATPWVARVDELLPSSVPA
jgi:hypothetical protein